MPPVQPAKPKKSVVPARVSRPCPGLTAAYNALVGDYLNRTGSDGGGARAVTHYSEKLFKKEFKDLSERQKEIVYSAQQHDHTWRNDVTPGIMASYATGTIACKKSVDVDAKLEASPPPCESCLLLFTSRPYQNAIKKPTPDPKNMRFVPYKNQNPHGGQLYAKFKGLEALVSEVRFTTHSAYIYH
jgi:hypothetical protein